MVNLYGHYIYNIVVINSYPFLMEILMMLVLDINMDWWWFFWVYNTQVMISHEVYMFDTLWWTNIAMENGHL